MISLEDLKKIIMPKNTDHSKLEYYVMHWLEYKELLSNDLSDDEIFYGLSHYLDAETMGLWRLYLNEKNIKIYTKLGSSIPLVDILLKEALNELEDQRAVINIADHSRKITFENAFAAQILQYENISFNLDDRFAKLLNFNNEKMNYPVNVSIKNNYLISSTTDSIMAEMEDYVLTSLDIVKNTIAISLVVMSLNSISAMAGDNSSELKEALQSSTKAFSKTEKGQEIITNVKTNGNREIKKFQKENPNAELPVAVLGYGLKVIKDGGINLKTRSNALLDDTTYEILVGKELEVSMSGKNPIAEDSTYKLQARPDLVQMNVNFAIDW